MKNILLLFFIGLLPLGVMAQSDTIYIKKSGKLAVNIQSVQKRKINYARGNEQASIPLSSVTRYYWAPPKEARLNADTISIIGSGSYPVTINRVEDGKVFFTSGRTTSFVAEELLSSYYWQKHLTPIRKDNTIVIETTDSPEEAFNKIGKALGEKGFGLISANAELGIIHTDEKATDAGALKLTAFVKSSDQPGTPIRVYISCQSNGYNSMVYSTPIPATPMTVSYIDHNGPQGISFAKNKQVHNVVYGIAKLYNGGSISYSER